MEKYNEKKMVSNLKKAAKGVVLSSFLAALIFAFGSDKLLWDFLIYETMPFYGMNATIPVFFKYSEDIDASQESEMVFNEDTTLLELDSVENNVELERTIEDTFEPEKIETNNILGLNNEIIGINDIIYQDEAEFGTIPDTGYKENFTADNLDGLTDIDYFISSFYIKDAKTGIIKSKFDPVKFLNTDLKIAKTIKGSGPQVLIFHTHAGTEYFIDSDTSNLSEGIVGAGEKLEYVLEEKYGIETLRYSGVFDMTDGMSDRNGSYERMEPVIQRILDENPTIELVIDLHRDGIEPNPNLVTMINGKPCAKFMFVNGLSALLEDGAAKEIASLKNPYLDTNLALSFNMQIAANELYPDVTRKIYLKPYRFSTHMKAKSLLVEIGSQHNTKEEAFNSMEILADLIESVVFN